MGNLEKKVRDRIKDAEQKGIEIIKDTEKNDDTKASAFWLVTLIKKIKNTIFWKK